MVRIAEQCERERKDMEVVPAPPLLFPPPSPLLPPTIPPPPLIEVEEVFATWREDEDVEKAKEQRKEQDEMEKMSLEDNDEELSSHQP